MTHIARLIVRLTVGGLLLGHGAQKLFGWFGGQGLDATSQWVASMNLRPPRFWAQLAGISEFFGGLLMMLGLLNPIGPLMVLGSMLMAWTRVHVGKPIWSTAGGAELPLTNIASALAIMLVGPGRISADGILGIRLPRWFGFAGLVSVVSSVVWAEAQSRQVEAEIASGTSSSGTTGAVTETTQTAEKAAARPSATAATAGAAGGELRSDAAEENFEAAAAAMSPATPEEDQPGAPGSGRPFNATEGL